MRLNPIWSNHTDEELFYCAENRQMDFIYKKVCLKTLIEDNVTWNGKLNEISSLKDEIVEPEVPSFIIPTHVWVKVH